jgi:hypothetical protein
VVFSVIPAEAGIQSPIAFRVFLDPSFHRGDDLLKDYGV